MIDYKQRRREGRDGFELSERYDLDQLTEKQREKILTTYNNDREGTTFGRTLDRWLQTIERKQIRLHDSSSLLSDRETNRNNDGLDQEALQGKPDGRSSEGNRTGDQGEGKVISSKTGFNGDNGPRYVTIQLSEY